MALMGMIGDLVYGARKLGAKHLRGLARMVAPAKKGLKAPRNLSKLEKRFNTAWRLHMIDRPYVHGKGRVFTWSPKVLRKPGKPGPSGAVYLRKKGSKKLRQVTPRIIGPMPRKELTPNVSRET